MLTHSLLVNYQDLPARVHSELEMFKTTRARHSIVRYGNVSFIVNELVQVNPDNSIIHSLSALPCKIYIAVFLL